MSILDGLGERAADRLYLDAVLAAVRRLRDEADHARARARGSRAPEGAAVEMEMATKLDEHAQRLDDWLNGREG